MEKEGSTGQSQVGRMYSFDEEVSLVELLKVLVKRWRTSVTVLVLCSLVGLMIVLIRQDAYQYNTTIELGSVLTKNGVYRQVPSNGSIKDKLTEAYIPKAYSDMASKGLLSHQGVHVKIARNGAVVLTSKGSVSDVDLIKELHRSVADSLMNDYNPSVEALRASYLQRISLLEERLRSLGELANEFKQHDQRLSKRLVEVESEYDRLLSDDAMPVVKDTYSMARRSKENGGDNGLSAVDQKLYEASDRRQLLTENLYKVELPRLSISNKVALLNTLIRIKDYEMEISDIQASLSASNTSRVLALAERSINPEGIGKLSVVMLSIVIGGILAVVSAFLHEGVSRVTR